MDELARYDSNSGVLRCLLVCIGLTLVLRLGWAAVMPFDLESDERAYFTFASHLSQGEGYGWEPHKPSAYWPVGTSALYAAVFMLTGPGKLGVVLVNLAASSAMTGLAVLLARRWFGGKFGAPSMWAAGLLFAAWPTSVMFATVLNSELVFGAVLMWVLLALATPEPPTLRRWLLAAPLLACLAYTRPTGLLVGPILACVHVARLSPPFAIGPSIRTLGFGVAATAVMLACIAPWTYRNYQAFDDFALISTNGGPVFWMGNNPDTDGTYMSLPDSVEGMSETERASMLKKEAWAYVRDDPAAFVTRSIKKLAMTHTTETIGVAWNQTSLERRFGEDNSNRLIEPGLKAIGSAFWLGTLGLGGVGWVLLWRSVGFWRAFTHPTLVMWVYFAGVHAIVLAQDRYHLQWSPMVMLLASVSLATLWNRVRSGGRPEYRALGG
ncbi:MAG: hypothetical protein AAGF47_04565 [Planctomycetota bacterium]